LTSSNAKKAVCLLPLFEAESIKLRVLYAVLMRQRILLVWENFDLVPSHDDNRPPDWSEQRQAELRRLAERVRPLRVWDTGRNW